LCRRQCDCRARERASFHVDYHETTGSGMLRSNFQCYFSVIVVAFGPNCRFFTQTANFRSVFSLWRSRALVRRIWELQQPTLLQQASRAAQISSVMLPKLMQELL
jgi:hypothetical protein